MPDPSPVPSPDPRDAKIAALEADLAAARAAVKPIPAEKGLPAVVDQDALRRLTELEREIALLKAVRANDDDGHTPYTIWSKPLIGRLNK